MISFPNAKINIGLDIIEKRNDGYHNLSSCFYPVPLSDVLEVVESKEFRISVTGIPLDNPEKDNLVVKAYTLLRKDFDLPPVQIHLHKIIPIGAGLGGGSSDGVFMLRMLNDLFELFLDDTILEDYALQLGSDCPFFIHNIPMIAEGRGDKLKKIYPMLDGYYIMIVKPSGSVSTQKAYQGIIPLIPENDIASVIQKYPPEEWPNLLKNDFETTVFDIQVELRSIKEELYQMGAAFALMTGSGSAVYGLFKDKPNPADVWVGKYYYWIGQL